MLFELLVAMLLDHCCNCLVCIKVFSKFSSQWNVFRTLLIRIQSSLKPMISGVVEEYENQIHFVEIDIEQDPEIALASDVMGTPVVQIFKDKARVETLNGVKMKKIYRSKIDAYV